MKKLIQRFSELMLVFGLFVNIEAQIIITPITPNQAVQSVLQGTGVTAYNVQYTGADVAIGKFTSNVPSMPFLSGIILSTGLASQTNFSAPNLISTNNFTGSDPQLLSIAGGEVFDAAVLEFDFIPESDTIRFRYIFGSDEYPEYVDMFFNDIFGFFISGTNPAGGTYLNKNIALIPGTNTPVSINNVSPVTNNQYYIDNSSSATLAFDGKTVVFTAWALVVPCTQYHLKLAVGDVADGIYDSGVFLEANSFSSPQVTVTANYSTSLIEGSTIEGCSDAQLVIKLPSAESSERLISHSFGGSAIFNTDYLVTPYDPSNPGFIRVPIGQDSVVLNIHPLIDHLTEPTETILFMINTSNCNTFISDTVSIDIINRDSLLVEVTGDTLLCQGDSAHLIASVVGGLEPFQYLWSNNYDQIEQTVLPDDSVTVFVFTVTDLCGFQNSDSITVFKSIVGFSLMNDTAICDGASVMLSGEGIGAITWTSLIGENPIVSPSQTTQYEATLSNICGESKDTVTVYVDTMPYFSLGADTVVCSQSPVRIGIPYNDNYGYLWSNGFETSQIMVDDPNTYILYVINGGCVNSDTIVVSSGLCDWWIPSAFTPNATGLNDEFKPIGVPVPKYEMIIYDRWGEVVYRTDDWVKGWDGTISNQQAPFGIYIYIKFLENLRSQKSGCF